MKKLTAAILALILLCLCAAAWAEEGSPSEPIPLVTQLETLAEEMGATVDTGVME